MQTPSKLQDITPAWLSEILDIKIDNENFNLTPNVQEGTGFLSNLVRVSCQTEINQSPIQLVVKLPPQNAYLEVLRVTKLDESEMCCYKKIIPQLVELCPDLKPNFCLFIYGNIDKGQELTSSEPYRSALVLEDLKPQGYRTIDFNQDLNMAQIKQAVEFLAKFHFAAYVHEAKLEKPLPEVYANLNPKGNAEIVVLLAESFKVVECAFQNSKGSHDPGVAAAYQKLASFSYQIFEMVVTSRKEYPCVIHGDFWSNNILYNDDSEKPMKVIDWQIASYNDPTFDLTVFLTTCIPKEELTKETVDKLLKLYYNIFEERSKNTNANFKKINIRKFEEFSEYFYTYGMAWALIWTVFSADAMGSNMERMLNILEFLETEVKISEFLLKIIK